VSGRLIAGLGGFLAAVAIVAWLRACDEARPKAPFRPDPGQFYAVDLSGASRSIDLEFDGGTRYELIVSSLGDAGRSFPVRLTARPHSRVESFPAVVVTPLQSRNIAQVQSPRFSGVVPAEGIAAAVERMFYLHVTADRLEDARGYVAVSGSLVGEGDQVRVYLDRQTSPADVAPGLMDDIIRLLNDEIIPRSRDFLGEHADIDGDGKLAVLVTGWLGRMCGGTTSLNGFVRANDFQPDMDVPFGNHADVIYLNTSVQPGPALNALLVHEYTHAVCFSRRLSRNGHAASLPVEDDWLNEAIAHVAENLHGGGWSNLDFRIARFLETPAVSPLAVRDYYRAGLWRDPGCRGATFLFLRFCADQFGVGLLRDLVHGPTAGKRNLERATQTAFSELFRHWTIALAEGTVASVPVQGKVGEYDLTGPARIAWPVAEGACSLTLNGTAAAYVELTGGHPSRVMRIAVEVEPQARLQLTLVRRAPYTSARK
jgi:hypothetical protein